MDNVRDVLVAIRADGQRVALAEARNAVVDAAAITTPRVVVTPAATVGRLAAFEAILQVRLGHGAVVTEMALGADALPADAHASPKVAAVIVLLAHLPAVRYRAKVDGAPGTVQYGHQGRVVELAGIRYIAHDAGDSVAVVACEEVGRTRADALSAGPTRADALLAKGRAIGGRDTAPCIVAAFLASTSGCRGKILAGR